MDDAKRVQGRPRQHDRNESGRDRLLTAARALLRQNPSHAAQRREVAMAAGVTPALLCYYFPDHSDLLEAAIRPILNNYLDALLAMLKGPELGEEKMRLVIRLLLRVNLYEPNFVDVYIELVRSKADGAEQVQALTSGYDALIEFACRELPAATARGLEPGVFIFALWGLCRSVAMRPRLPVSMTDHSKAHPDETELVEQVLRMIQFSPQLEGLS